MIRTDRWCVWVGNPTWFFKANRGLVSHLSFSNVERGPSVEMEGVDAIATWLSPRLPVGGVIDVIHQNHLVLVESFPRLGYEELESAFEIRLRRDPLVDPSTLTSHLVAHQRTSGSQAIFAAVAKTRHRAIERPIEAAGCKVGRVGFAGQLAVRAAIEVAPRGGWGIIDDLADASALIIVHTNEGAVFCDYASDPADLIERLRIKLPGLDVETARVEILPPSKEPVAHETALPGGVEKLVSIFEKETHWRRKSRSDLDYPHGLALSTWSILALAGFLALYTVHLILGSRQIDTSAASLARLDAEAARLKTTEQGIATRRAALEHLESDITIVGAEAFDTAGWLRFISRIRDGAAHDLLFESVDVQSREILLSGTHTSSKEVLDLHRELGHWLGPGDVRLSGLQESGEGSEAFTIRIVRSTAQPPTRPPEEVPIDG